MRRTDIGLVGAAIALIVLFVSLVTAAQATTHVVIKPGTIATSTGRIVAMDRNGCYHLRKRETDLGMALNYCPKEIKP